MTYCPIKYVILVKTQKITLKSVLDFAHISSK